MRSTKEVASVFSAAICMALALPLTAWAQAVAAYDVTADGIVAPLLGLAGNAVRGREIAFDPERGNCTICHSVPGGDPRVQGTVGPSLAGVGQRLTAAQLRLRVVDGTRINPATIMPSYHRVIGLNRVGREWVGKPVLGAQEVEDLVSYLGTLKG